MEPCILAIGVFAVVWTLMGGMRTVIWTDVIQFGIFMFGGLLAFGWLVGAPRLGPDRGDQPPRRAGRRIDRQDARARFHPAVGGPDAATTPSGSA